MIWGYHYFRKHPYEMAISKKDSEQETVVQKLSGLTTTIPAPSTAHIFLTSAPTVDDLIYLFEIPVT